VEAKISHACVQPGYGFETGTGHPPLSVSFRALGTAFAILSIAACGVLLPASGGCRAGERIVISGPASQQVFVLPGKTFDLSWIHSVERTEWRETFAIDPSGRIALAASEFASAGAGLPGMPNGREIVRLSDGKMRLTGSRLVLDDLEVHLSDLSHHYLRTEDRLIDLNAIFGEGIISIRAEKKEKGGNDAKD
jgi:hypothetical protein